MDPPTIHNIDDGDADDFLFLMNLPSSADPPSPSPYHHHLSDEYNHHHHHHHHDLNHNMMMMMTASPHDDHDDLIMSFCFDKDILLFPALASHHHGHGHPPSSSPSSSSSTVTTATPTSDTANGNNVLAATDSSSSSSSSSSLSSSSSVLNTSDHGFGIQQLEVPMLQSMPDNDEGDKQHQSFFVQEYNQTFAGPTVVNNREPSEYTVDDMLAVSNAAVVVDDTESMDMMMMMMMMMNDEEYARHGNVAISTGAAPSARRSSSLLHQGCNTQSKKRSWPWPDLGNILQKRQQQQGVPKNNNNNSNDDDDKQEDEDEEDGEEEQEEQEEQEEEEEEEEKKQVGTGSRRGDQASQREMHVQCERQRRKSMSDTFNLLQSLVPSLSKLAKASDRLTVLTEVMAHIRSLRRRLKEVHCKGREVLHILRTMSAHPEVLIVNNNNVFPGPRGFARTRNGGSRPVRGGAREMSVIAPVSGLESVQEAGEPEEEEAEEDAEEEEEVEEEDGGDNNNSKGTGGAWHVAVRMNSSTRGAGRHDVLVTVNYSHQMPARVAALPGNPAGPGPNHGVNTKHKPAAGLDGVWSCLMRMLRRYGVEVCSSSLSAGGPTIFHRIHGKILNTTVIQDIHLQRKLELAIITELKRCHKI